VPNAALQTYKNNTPQRGKEEEKKKKKKIGKRERELSHPQGLIHSHSLSVTTTTTTIIIIIIIIIIATIVLPCTQSSLGGTCPLPP